MPCSCDSPFGQQQPEGAPQARPGGTQGTGEPQAEGGQTSPAVDGPSGASQDLCNQGPERSHRPRNAPTAAAADADGAVKPSTAASGAAGQWLQSSSAPRGAPIPLGPEPPIPSPQQHARPRLSSSQGGSPESAAAAGLQDAAHPSPTAKEKELLRQVQARLTSMGPSNMALPENPVRRPLSQGTLQHPQPTVRQKRLDADLAAVTGSSPLPQTPIKSPPTQSSGGILQPAQPTADPGGLGLSSAPGPSRSAGLQGIQPAVRPGEVSSLLQSPPAADPRRGLTAQAAALPNRSNAEAAGPPSGFSAQAAVAPRRSGSEGFDGRDPHPTALRVVQEIKRMRSRAPSGADAMEPDSEIMPAGGNGALADMAPAVFPVHSAIRSRPSERMVPENEIMPAGRNGVLADMAPAVFPVDSATRSRPSKRMDSANDEYTRPPRRLTSPRVVESSGVSSPPGKGLPAGEGVLGLQAEAVSGAATCRPGRISAQQQLQDPSPNTVNNQKTAW